MVTLTIDGKTVTVEPGTNLIEAARMLGIEIPHYCYHPGLPVVGQCRMCQVEVEKSPKLGIACSTPASTGMVVHTDSPEVVKARKAVLEFYLLNHPLDCPICDKGGECPLQDYTVTYGPGESRYREEKVKRVKALPIGPTVVFDAERCILCTRCVRFVQDVVKSGELGVFHRGDRAEIGLFPGKELDNLYSLNVVDLCPVGALTSRDYRFRARPWDLFRQVESVCPGCSFGCNIVLDVRHWDEGEQIVRIRPRVNMEVNTYWMCDIGRFTFHPLYEKERLDGPWIRKEGGLVPTSWEEAIAFLASSLGRIIVDHGPGSVGAIVSSRLTNEELYLLQRFFRQVVGTEHLDHRMRGVQEPGRDYQEDHLLLRADRTPNTRGARDMGVLPGPGGLETMGMIEARHGMGIYVTRAQPPLAASAYDVEIGAFELIEARRLFEGEAAALAAATIDEDSLDELERLLGLMADEDELKGEDADKEFHMVIARATGNGAIIATIENMWELRNRSPLARNILTRARGTGLEPRIVEHRRVLEALKAHDPAAARQAMRDHLERVIEHLLRATETEALERAQQESKARRSQIAKRVAI